MCFTKFEEVPEMMKVPILTPENEIKKTEKVEKVEKKMKSKSFKKCIPMTKILKSCMRNMPVQEN